MTLLRADVLIRVNCFTNAFLPMMVHVIVDLAALVVMVRFGMSFMTVLLLDAIITHLFEAFRTVVILTVFIRVLTIALILVAVS